MNVFSHWPSFELSALANSVRLLRSLAARNIPTNPDEWKSRQLDVPEQPDNARQLRVALLGVPNSGKSRLTNALSGWSACGVSRRAHTTRSSSASVVTDTASGCQLLLEDTPGVVTADEVRRYRLTKSLLRDPAAAIRRADMVCVLHDVTDRRGRRGICPKVQQLLFELPRLGTPSVLVLTKVDLLKDKRALLDITSFLAEKTNSAGRSRSCRASSPPDLARSIDILQQEGVEVAEGFWHAPSPEAAVSTLDRSTVSRLRELVLAGAVDQLTEQQRVSLSLHWRTWPLFQQVFMTSTLDGEQERGVRPLLDFLMSVAVAGRWRYGPSVVTNQSPHRLAKNLVSSQLLEFLPCRLPYEIECRIEEWSVDETGALAVQMALLCRRQVDARLVVRRVRLIAQSAEQLLRDAFRCDVLLRLRVYPDPKPLSEPHLEARRQSQEEAKLC